MAKLKVTIPYPEGTALNKPLSVLLGLEQIRQGMFDVFADYCKSCYMKYTVEDVITGDSYQSRSALIITAKSANMNGAESLDALKYLGASITVLPAEDEAWKDRIAELRKKADI